MSAVTSGTASTMSVISSTSTTHSIPRVGNAPPAAYLLEAGYPGIQYPIVDPGNQYQKYLIVKVQCPSGTDPLTPPNFNARLQDNGHILEMTVPVTNIFANTNLLVHRNATWMRDGDSYKNARQTRLGGLGPAIAQINTYFHGQPWSTVWRLPLAEPCDEIVGNYAITNFPVRSNRANQKFYPVVAQFKLKTIEQTVKREARINTGIWESDSGSDNDDHHFDFVAAATGSPSKKTCFEHMKNSSG